MAQKFDVISELYDRACLEIITDPVKWQSFLQTAGRNFKLRFDEQFLLFIQRPDATAVLEIERWNETFERWVNKGAKGIAVFESANRSRQRLIHYFDISDTHESSHSRPVPIWNMKPEYETTVIEALKNAFGSVYDITSLESVIKESVSNIIKNNTEKYVSDFMNVGLGSDIKSLPTEEANSLYLNFVKDSVSYMIMARLGLDVDKIYSPSDFAVLSKFNSQEVFNAVGVATNKTAKIALEQIAKSILMYEQKNRTFDLSENKNYNADVNKNEGRNNYGNNIHAGGRLSSSGLEATGTTGSNAGKMGSDEEKLPEGRARNHILQSTDERDSDSALGRSGRESNGIGRELSQADGERPRRDRAAESRRYDEMGRSDEQHQTLGSGNREGTSDLRLDAKPLPSVNEQLKLFEQAEVSNTTTSAFSIPQEVIDATVRQGSGFVDGKMRIYEQFQKSFSTKENADFLKKEYGIGGSSHAGGFEGYSKNFDAKGLEIYKGYAEDRPRVMLKWSQVATLIEQQISQGRYLNDKESARYPQWLEKEEARRAEIEEEKRNRGENFSIKQLEKSRKAVKQKLEKLNDQSRKDDVVTFEELGVDRLFIDESHYYKNLYLYTKMRNVGGIAQTEAQKSSDLFMKCRYLDELTGGRGTVFATGTPISNSMVELYTIQRYLQYNTLVKNNLQHFDAWASTFGETVTAVELTPEGTGYRAKTRFAKFYNLPELMAMFKEVADIKTADMLDLPVPQAHYHNIAVKPSEMQKEMVASLAERAEKVRGGAVDSSVDNMLKITNDGRKLALDQRMLNDMLPDFEDSKINACVDNIYRIWTETADKKSAQLVFCDLSTPKNDGTFSVYDDIRKKLIERGIPDSEVKFIHEADTDIKKKELFQKTRKGEVRVLLGSTQKMGAGTNVQDRLIALHDVDCPWRPSDLEQRSGRIIRQGNSNPDVDIYRYVTEQTFDAYLYQLVEGKQKFASQIMTSKSPVRSAEDIDETALSYAEIKMLATGNPYIKEKMDLDIQVQKLKLLKSNFLSEKYRLEDKIIKYYPQQITSLQNKIEGLKQDVETAKQHPKPTDDRFVGMEVKGVFYSEKAEAGKAIIEACKLMSSPEPIYLGKYRGFDMELSFDTLERTYMIKIKGSTSRNVFLGEDSYGNITRIDNGVEKFSEALSFAENELANTKAQFETAKTEVEKPFAQDEELKTKLARLDELNILLNMDKTENEIVGGEPDESEVPPEKKVKEYELTR